jgi:oligoribonuclease (3'-5' exoribonuclease)
MAYLFLDNEMGGLDRDQHSLLTVYLAVFDEHLMKLDELYLYLRPNDGIYKVVASAMAVNKIDIVQHDGIAITYKEGGTELYNFLKRNSKDGADKLIPVGHGIHGDIDWILYHLISRGSWNVFVSYRKLDTSAVAQFLKSCGRFPETVSGSLKSLAEFFNVPFKEEELHDARVDTLISVAVFDKLRKYIQ